MTLSSYLISLEEYIQQYVNYKGIESARENGTYDKAIMASVLKFTRMSSPLKTWGVKRPELFEDMRTGIETFYQSNAIRTADKAYAFRNRYGDIRVVFTDSPESYLWELDFVPDRLRSELRPVDDLVELTDVTAETITTVNGDSYDLRYGLFIAVVNGFGRIGVYKQTEAI